MDRSKISRRSSFLLAASAAFLFAAPLSQAATIVDWFSPANNSSFDIGTVVTPNGGASAVGGPGAGLEVGVIMDSSGSMRSIATSGGVTQTRADWQKDAATALVNGLPTDSSAAAVAEFDSSASVIQSLTPLSTNLSDILDAIDLVDASGGTNIGSGIDAGVAELTGPAHTDGAQRHLVVFSDGDSSGNPSINAANAVAAGIDAVHAIALPGASLPTMEGIATAGGGTFANFSDAGDLMDLVDFFSGIGGGSLVQIDLVELILPDGTVIPDLPTDAFGNFTSPSYALQAGANVFTARAFGTDGTMAEAQLTLFGVDEDVSGIPEPGSLSLLGGGLLIGATLLRRRKNNAG